MPPLKGRPILHISQERNTDQRLARDRGIVSRMPLTYQTWVTTLSYSDNGSIPTHPIEMYKSQGKYLYGIITVLTVEVVASPTQAARHIRSCCLTECNSRTNERRRQISRPPLLRGWCRTDILLLFPAPHQIHTILWRFDAHNYQFRKGHFATMKSEIS